MIRSLIRFSLKTPGAEHFYLAVEKPYLADVDNVLEERHLGLFTHSAEMEYMETADGPAVSPALPDFWLPQDWNRFLRHVDELARTPEATAV